MKMSRASWRAAHRGAESRELSNAEKIVADAIAAAEAMVNGRILLPPEAMEVYEKERHEPFFSFVHR